jgi:hypothetical protein
MRCMWAARKLSGAGISMPPFNYHKLSRAMGSGQIGKKKLEFQVQ